MFPVFSCISLKSKEMANTCIYRQVSCVTQNVIVFLICAQNHYSLSKTQQKMEMERGRGVVLVHFEFGLFRLKLSCSFPFILFSRKTWGSTRQKLPFVFFCFSPEGVASGRSPEAAFSNLKSASRQISRYLSVYMEQHYSTGLPVTKKKTLKILGLGETAVFDSSLISKSESLYL